MTKICCISDVHGKWKGLKIPECDLLISAGDYSFTGEQHMIRDFHKWLDDQPAHHVISLNGNHEKFVEKNFQLAKEIALKECPAVHFMEEGLVEIDGLKIWCSAITPYFHNWAYNRMRGPDIRKHWDLIPNDVDVLVTHGPPFNILDNVQRFNGQKCEYEIEHVGCEDLLARIQKLKQLKLHIFGHIHDGYGTQKVGDTIFANASICDEQYRPTHKPLIFEI